MHTCIFACVSNETCLTYEGKNVWELLNLHCNRSLECSIQHTKYIHIQLFLGLMYNRWGVYIYIYLLIEFGDLRRNLQ